MKPDYLLISQLKPSEVHDYLKQKTLSLPEKKRCQKKECIMRDILSLGTEFFLLFLSFVVIGSFVSLVFLALGAILALLFAFSFYITRKKIIKFEKFLRNMHVPRIRAFRDGKEVVLSEKELEIGDVILISKGERVPVDIRITESNSLIVDETKVFGEQRRVGKSAVTLPKKDFKIYELSNIVFANSLVVKGSGKGIVINKTHNSEETPEILNYKENLTHTLLILGISALVALIFFYLRGDYYSGLILFSAIVFLLSRRYQEIGVSHIKYLATKELLLDGIIIPSINRPDEYEEIGRTVIKVDLLSFDIYKPTYFIVRERKQFSVMDLLSLKGEIPLELLYCFIASKTIHSKTKDTSLKVFLNPIINSLSSIGISERNLENYEILEVQISNSIHNLSSVKIKNGREIFLGMISLSSYTRQFGKIDGVDTDKDSIVLLMRDTLSPSEGIRPVLVILLDMYDTKPVEIDKLERYYKFFLLSELPIREISKLFGAIGVNISKLSSADAEDLLSVSEEQKKFILERFQLFFNVTNRNLPKLVELFSQSNNRTLDTFLEISQSDVGIMKIPYFGTFFSKNNLILSTTKSFLVPFILKDHLTKLRENLRRFKPRVMVISIVSVLVSVVLCFYGFPWMLLLAPVIGILTTSVLPNLLLKGRS